MKITNKELNIYKAMDKIIEKEVIRIFYLLFNKHDYRYESFSVNDKNIRISYNKISDEYYNLMSYFQFPIKYLNYGDKNIKRAKQRGEI